MRQPTGVAWKPVEPNWLNAREARAWRAFIDAHDQIEVHLNRRLQESGLSGADYSVLASLSALDEGRMPAHALCNAGAGRRAVYPTSCGACRRTG